MRLTGSSPRRGRGSWRRKGEERSLMSWCETLLSQLGRFYLADFACLSGTGRV